MHFLVLDADPTFGAAFAQQLARWAEVTVLPSCRAATRAAARVPFSICFTDTHLPDGPGLELLRLMRRDRPHLSAMALASHFKQADSVEACTLGAQYVVKPISRPAVEAFVTAALDAEELRRAAGPLANDAVKAPAAVASAHRLYLTPKEQQVCDCLVLRLSNLEIAERHHISIETARTHVKQVLSKLGVHSRRHVASALSRLGPLTPREQ
jgi:two-component system nitrate/nitrite response regulator NarL